MDNFQLLRAILAGQESVPDRAAVFADGYMRRLIDAVHFNRGGCRDLAVLARCVLRAEDERQGTGRQVLTVPSAPPWPNPGIWAASGMRLLPAGDGMSRVRAEKWRPGWLSGPAPAQPAYAGVVRRSFRSVTGDPFLRRAGLDSYRCAGQREAVRAVLTAPPGSTLLINLPTGVGKSLCMYLPSLIGGATDKLTVVVVPTTALAMDQEQALAGFIPHPTAYYHSPDPGDEQRNRGIYQRIREGGQKIVFTSPEALLGSLQSAVYTAAEQGRLAYLAVDEAHMVDLWGDEFRPAFQELAGLRADLLRRTQPALVTLLLSATVTAPGLDMMKHLFAGPGLFRMVSAVQLRPEPGYWFAHCRTEAEKHDRVLEILHHAPRPLILYTTEVAHAEQWRSRLRDLGFRRCEAVTGQTGARERLRIISRWRQKQTDLMVATSAFGLGVDQADVRTVLHACFPENVDRYYQEVGRGGRDGAASLSFVVYTDADYETARALNARKIITVGRGLQRWRRMFENKETLIPGRYRVPVDVPPSGEPGDIDMDNRANTAWNVRTLTLMARAGLVDLDREPLRGDPSGPGEYRVVRVRDEGHLDADVWRERVEPVRQRAMRFSRRSLEYMTRLVRGRECVAGLIADVYAIGTDDHPRVMVSKSCGGCPYCRQRGTAPFAGVMPEPQPVWPPSCGLGPELARVAGDSHILSVFYVPGAPDPRERRRRGRLLEWFVGQGIRNLVVPRTAWEQAAEVVERVSAKAVFFFDKFEPLRMPKVPTLILHEMNLPVPRSYLRGSADGQQAPLRVLWLAENARHPQKDHCLLRHTGPGRCFGFEELCAEVGL